MQNIRVKVHRFVENYIIYNETEIYALNQMKESARELMQTVAIAKHCEIVH